MLVIFPHLIFLVEVSLRNTPEGCAKYHRFLQLRYQVRGVIIVNKIAPDLHPAVAFMVHAIQERMES
jgi:hypothetical protein